MGRSDRVPGVGAVLMLGVTGLSACAATPASGAPALPGPSATSAQASPVAPSDLDAAWLYICNQDDATVSVVDMNTLTVVRTIDLQQHGYSATAKPHHIAVEPDGSFWYVSLIGEGKVVKFDREDRMVGEAPFETPGMLSLHPDEDLLLVGRSMSAVNPPSRIGLIRRSDMSIDEIDVFFPRPHALALNPRTGIAYTASLAVNQLASVDLDRERVQLTNLEGGPHALMQFALSPDGGQLALSGELSHTVFFFDLADPLSPRQVAAVDVGAQPFDPIYTPDGRFVYLGNKTANTITAIDAASFEVVKVFEDPRILQPHGAVVSPDGRSVFISSTNVREDHTMHGGEHAGHGAPAAPVRGGNGNVVVIDVATQEISAVIELGNNVTGMGTRTRP